MVPKSLKKSVTDVKSRMTKVKTPPPPTKQVESEGFVFVGKRNWKVFENVKYLLKSAATFSYVTTTAIKGQNLEEVGFPHKFPGDGV